jgi:hypothetical protein
MIPIGDVREAADIASLAVTLLLGTSSDQQGRSGSDLRRACGDVLANGQSYIVHNTIGPALNGCFIQARLTGATLDEFNNIRAEIDAVATVSQVAIMIQQTCVAFCLQQMAQVLVTITFTSREDVDRVRVLLVAAFAAAEETAADEMASAIYRSLISLDAAIMFFLYDTARPLPQILDFQFAAIRPTLIQSYRLYSDASRADELRNENKVVHPAFSPRIGRALSF